MAKRDYRRRIEKHLDSNYISLVLQEVQQITNHRTSHGAAEGDASIAEELNNFFAQLELELLKVDVTQDLRKIFNL